MNLLVIEPLIYAENSPHIVALFCFDTFDLNFHNVSISFLTGLILEIPIATVFRYGVIF